MRAPHHDVLFTPLPIGPKRARNRFYQVPHCNGMGHREPLALAAMRGTKAEGGWAVVCTEEVEIHPSSEVAPSIEGRLWSDADIPAHALVVEAIHAHGALAGIELVYNGPRSNLASRLPAMGVSAGPVVSDSLEPVQGRAMDKNDIRDVRRWHAQAAARARVAGYDLVYCYAGHSLALAQHFLSPAWNDRSDEYGGSLANRARFLIELIDATREAIGPDLALPLRLSVEEGHLHGGLSRAEIEDLVGMLDPLVDLFDFCMGSWPADSATARAAASGYQEDFVRGLKGIATKPVVGVGRFTSPDDMVAQIRTGVLDFVGAARPSIADPFLPAKIEAGAYNDIRECIGCNICVSGDNQSVPLRCTQNPTMGEEWRRGWHPERIAQKRSDARVLVVGAGPAGLEAAVALGKRGYVVALAEADDALGGRARKEAMLPGLGSFRRVAEHRQAQLAKLDNVAVYPASRMGVDDVLAFGADHVAIATGARWRRDGVGRHARRPVPIDPRALVLTPEDIFDGAVCDGPVFVHDDDHYVLGGAIAEAMTARGLSVTLSTPAPLVSSWTQLTLEQGFIERRLVALGVRLATRRVLEAIGADHVVTRCDLTGARFETPARTIVLVTSRIAEDALHRELQARRADWTDASVASVATIGDAHAPAMIVHAVHAGHFYARALDEDADPAAFKRLTPRL
jgi:dimethylamine/trimethylamine dehydrogenase